MNAVRPRFELTSALAPDELAILVGRALRSPGCPVSGLAAEGRLELHVHGAQQHLWSPQLIVELSQSETGTRLRGRFGPHPSVWTMYVAGYAACAFSVLVGMSFACAQWVMEDEPWAALSLPVGLLAASGLYGLAFIGQSAGAGQMDLLRDYLEKQLAVSEAEARAMPLGAAVADAGKSGEKQSISR